MKVLTVVGARPQFVKAATISRVFDSLGVNEIILHTGQHFDKNMSDVFFEEMKIPYPNYKLDINGLSHGAMTGRMLEGIESVLMKEKPDLLLVYGDTNSTLAGALAAQKLNIDIAHVEAGLRSFNMEMPEETNRILTDRVSKFLFCPTETAVVNLKNEGYDGFQNNVFLSGDVMYDAALFYSAISAEKSTILKELGVIDNYVLATVHRQENTDSLENLKSIIDSLNDISRDMSVIVPMHPRTRAIIAKQGYSINFKMIDPVGYFDMIELIKHSRLVMTDSGGLQKEAFFFEKPCITLREQTEWVELVDNGYNVLTGADHNAIIESYKKMLKSDFDFSMELYGKGDAALNIVTEIIKRKTFK